MCQSYEFVKALGWATGCKICLIKIFSSPILATSLSAYGKIRRKKAMIVTDVNSLEPGRTAVVGDEIKKTKIKCLQNSETETLLVNASVIYLFYCSDD